MQFTSCLVWLHIITLEVKSCGAERRSPSAHITTPQGLEPSQALASRNKQTGNSVTTFIVLTLGYALFVQLVTISTIYRMILCTIYCRALSK
jgi:hypothetical protein